MQESVLCNYAVPVPTTHRWGQDRLQGWSQTPAPAQQHCALPAQAAHELMLQEGERRALVPKSHLSPNLSLLTSYAPGKSTDACKSKQFLTNTVMSSNRNRTRHWPIYFLDLAAQRNPWISQFKMTNSISSTRSVSFFSLV